MLKKTKIRVAIGSGAALAVVAGALATTAYASPTNHAQSTSNNPALTANVATFATTAKRLSSTVPATGDVNPYGVAVVPTSIGHLVRGDILVSNFNNKNNLGGTGSTIVEVNPVTGRESLFAHLTASSLPATCPGGLGLTTALTVLKDGWVVAGSVPTADGTAATLRSGCLIVLNSLGKPRLVITGHGIDGPWDLTAVDDGNVVDIFVSNVLNGTVAGMGRQVNEGTVVRLRFAVSRQHFMLQTAVIVASGLPEQTSAANLVSGPTGLAVIRGTLYIADTLANRIAFVPDADTRHTTDHLGGTLAEAGLLNAPLGLTALPNGVLLVVNGNNGNLVAVTTRGRTALVKTLDSTPVAGSLSGAGTLFGVATATSGRLAYYVDDATNTLDTVSPLLG
jgi:hypothetical protein